MRRMRGVGADWLRIRSLSAKLAIALIAGSVIFFVSRSDVLLLVPGAVLSGALWQLITYGFIASDPLGVIFGAQKP